MKKDRVKSRTTFLTKAAAAIFAAALLPALAGCGVFDGGKAEVKVDFGQYADTDNKTSGAGDDGAQPDRPGSEAETMQGGDAAAPGEADGSEAEGSQNEGSQSEEGQPESSRGEGGELQAPAGRRDEFNKSEFAAELLAYLAANGRGEEAFSEPIFDTEKRVYGKEELEKLSDVMCKIFRNEIYARHGMIFGDEDLNQLYGAFSWYEGTIGLKAFEAQAELPFNENEYANITNIVAIEKARREQGAN